MTHVSVSSPPQRLVVWKIQNKERTCRISLKWCWDSTSVHTIPISRPGNILTHNRCQNDLVFLFWVCTMRQLTHKTLQIHVSISIYQVISEWCILSKFYQKDKLPELWSLYFGIQGHCTTLLWCNRKSQLHNPRTAPDRRKIIKKI